MRSTPPLTAEQADQWMHESFEVHSRDPRSPAYKDGLRRALMHANGDNTTCPYKKGTAERDAWYAGWQEGQHHWHDQSD